MLRYFLLLILVLNCVLLFGQEQALFLTINSPSKQTTTFSGGKQFITGLTCKTCSVTINGDAVKVYNTGAFAKEIFLKTRDSSFTITAANPANKQTAKNISFVFTPLKKPQPVSSLSIESIKTMPEGNLVLQAGDVIQLRVKALPGSTVSTFNNTPLYEMPLSLTDSMPGIYQGEYVVKVTDNFSGIKLPVTLTGASGEKITRETNNIFSVMSPLASNVAITTGRLANLKYGLGDDRLGGAKIGYLDSLIPLKIIGKVGSDYKVILAKNRTAYINEEYVTLAPKGTFLPEALSASWRVLGDSVYDYVQVAFSARLPYQSMQKIDPAEIVVDIFGATNNTNWIAQLQSAKEITSVDYEQISDDILRLHIKLKHKQHWGHQLYYRGNTLVIKIKQQPASLAISKLKIGIDAGHGGSNTGAQGISGAVEKNLTLGVALQLKNVLEAAGARVIMTRNTERFFDNQQRILFFRDSLPDLLISIHMNSANDPINAGGTMMFYRHLGYKSLSSAVYEKMIELPVKKSGIVGSFNFMLNSPTEYPNALVETLFISNPAEEALIVDAAFQRQVAEKIAAGINEFLRNADKP